MGSVDKVLGLLLFVASVTIFVYYTTWILVAVRLSRSMGISSNLPNLPLFYFSFLLQPFVTEVTFIHKLFPPQEYAILIPATLLVLAIFLVSAFAGVVLIKEANKKKKK